ncbi:hypothetical protein CLE01_29290 [Cryobacterium levicorallinum]|nr:hypothetical protein CLE01_29290 [Cryobacterium levicorallinum]
MAAPKTGSRYAGYRSAYRYRGCTAGAHTARCLGPDSRWRFTNLRAVHAQILAGFSNREARAVDSLWCWPMDGPVQHHLFMEDSSLARTETHIVLAARAYGIRRTLAEVNS